MQFIVTGYDGQNEGASADTKDLAGYYLNYRAG